MKERGTLEKFDEAITIMLPVLWILLAIVALYTCCKVVFYWRFSVRKEPNQVQLEVEKPRGSTSARFIRVAPFLMLMSAVLQITQMYIFY